MATTIASPFGVAGLNESGPRPYLFAVTETMARHAGGGIVIVLSAMALWLGLPDLAADARIALIAFVGALVGWTVMKLPDASVAIAAAVALVLTGTVNDRALFDTLGEDLVWLLIASFVMAAVLRRSGVAERLARRLLCRIGRVDRLLTVTTLFIFATAFLIPSTSARAAMLLPVFVALSTAIRRPAVTRAMALLFPTAILFSAAASLTGAGAHLVAADMMMRLDAGPITFIGWAALGAPFALASCLVANVVIQRVFLSGADRRARFDMGTSAPRSPELVRTDRYITVVASVTVALWATSSLHGLNLALVALVGALAISSKALAGVSLKDALKGVEWNLLMFMAGTLVLGETLLNSGAATFLVDTAMAEVAGRIAVDPVLMVGFAVVVALLAHLVVTSRTARATVLIPTLALPLAGFGLNPAALVFIVVVGSGFCQTLMISAKPVTLFGGLDTPTFSGRDLLVLSLLLAPLKAALLMIFAIWIWPTMGLPVIQ